MRNWKFYKFSPSGNTTLLLDVENARLRNKRPLIEAVGADGVPAEQAGYADVASCHLEMAGGEFCANASRAMGALMDLRARRGEEGRNTSRKYRISVSGMSDYVEIDVEGSCPCWQVSASFNSGQASFETSGHGALVKLPGIAHFLWNVDFFPPKADLPALAAKAYEKFSGFSFPAFGVVWHARHKDKFEILPYVHVRDANTAMLESSCGSASMALALLNHRCGERNEIRVGQPSGDDLICAVEADDRSVTLSGVVKLCASGQLWLNNCEE